MSRLKKLREKARQLETVLSDLKSRDFIQSPKIQELMAKVTVKGLKNVPFTNNSKNSSSKSDGSQNKSGSKTKPGGKDKTFRGRLKTLETQISPQIAKDLVQTIMKKADEIRSSYWNNGEPKAGKKPAAKRAPLKKRKNLGKTLKKSSAKSKR